VKIKKYFQVFAAHYTPKHLSVVAGTPALYLGNTSWIFPEYFHENAGIVSWNRP